MALFALTPAFYAVGERLLRSANAKAPEPQGDRVVIIGSPERVSRLGQIVTDTLPNVTVVASDVSGLGGSAGPRRNPSVRLIVVDSSAGPAVAGIVTAAVQAEPAVPTIVRTSQRLDVDNVKVTDEDLTLIVDEEAGDTALARAIARVMAERAGR